MTEALIGELLHRVRLTLSGPITTPLTAVSNDRGEFEILDVPPGAYTLSAARAGYLTIQYGQTRPHAAGRTIRVLAGQILGHVDIALYPGAMLVGRITDEVGEPAAKVLVEAVEARLIRGRRVLVPAASTTTDVIGDFRLSGLPPGNYSVRASTRANGPGEPRTAQTHAFALTYFPGTSEVNSAGVIPLAVGQEVEHLDFTLALIPTLRISGRVESSDGEPLSDMSIGVFRIVGGPSGALAIERLGMRIGTDKGGSFECNRPCPHSSSGHFVDRHRDDG